jgi:hypothetical protein
VSNRYKFEAGVNSAVYIQRLAKVEKASMHSFLSIILSIGHWLFVPLNSTLPLNKKGSNLGFSHDFLLLLSLPTTKKK